MNEKGISLPELLAAIVLAAIIGSIAYMILFTGMKTNERVQVEGQLRDEADLIMTWLIEDFYTLKSSEIVEKHLPETNTNDYYFVIENQDEVKQIGFIGGKVYYNEGEIKPNDKIKLNGSQITEVEDGQFEIILNLEDENTGHNLQVKSEIGIIRDS